MIANSMVLRGAMLMITSLVLVQTTLADGDRYQRDIDRAQAALDDAAAKLGKRLDEAIGSELRAVRNQSNLKAEERQAVIDMLTDEQTTFAKVGTVPFSPRMRAGTLNYLAELNAAEAKLAKAFDQAIASAIRAKDDTKAAQLAARKDETCRRIVGAWHCRGVNFRREWTWQLYSDGSTNSPVAKWNITKGGLMIINKAPDAPKDGFVDTITMNPDARGLTAKNQLGGAYVGQRIHPTK